MTGWGRTETGTPSDALLQAILSVINNDDCRKLLDGNKDNINVTPSIICASSSNSDTCYGDSGGPAIYASAYNRSVRHFQYGIISVGPKGCDLQSSFPSIFTRVSSFMPWILSTITK